MGLIFFRALPDAEFRHRAAHGFKPPYYTRPGSDTSHGRQSDAALAHTKAEAEIRRLRAERHALRTRLDELERGEGKDLGPRFGAYDNDRLHHSEVVLRQQDRQQPEVPAVRIFMPDGSVAEQSAETEGLEKKMRVQQHREVLAGGHNMTTETGRDEGKLRTKIQPGNQQEREQDLHRRLKEIEAERDDFQRRLEAATTDRYALLQRLDNTESDRASLETLYRRALSDQMHYLSQLRYHRGTISVVVRIRPPLCSPVPPPISSPAATYTITPPGTIHLSRLNDCPESFAFDSVISGPSSSAELCTQVSSLASAAVQSGCRAAVFAYGRTGTGKSHTLGEVVETVASCLFPGAAADDDGSSAVTATSAKVSLVEVYNDRLFDLLAAKKQQRQQQQQQHAKDGSSHQQPEVKVKGTGATVDITRCAATCETVTSATQLTALVARGNARRAVSATSCNAVSSRSHSILTIQLATAGPHGTGTPRGGGGGTFVVIDLAGHEDVSKSGVADRAKAFAEAKSINQSLLNLGKVFSELGNVRPLGKKQPASLTASFRADLLTRVFGWVLGYALEPSTASSSGGGGRRREARSRVLMVATVALDNADMVVGARHTLGYAAQAARVRLDAVDAVDAGA